MKGLGKHKSLILFEGIAFCILGFIALAFPVLFSLSLEVLLGALFVVGGAVQCFRSLQLRKLPGFLWTLLGAVASIIVGILLLVYPLVGLITLTLLLSLFLLIQGASQITWAIHCRQMKYWGWLMVSGVLSVTLATILFLGLPSIALWAWGVLVGIQLLISGISQIFFSSRIGNNPR